MSTPRGRTITGRGNRTMTSYAGINPEITDSYRRTLEFNNSLLLQQFDQRCDFQTGEQVRKMRHGYLGVAPASEEKIQKYVETREKNKEKRRETYEKRLTANVEPSIQRYAHNIRMFISGSGEESYI